jgi:dTDP-4-dehydrorhamnose reductase
MALRGKTILIVGAEGWVGRALARRFQDSGARILRTSRRPAAEGPDCTVLDLAGDVRAWRPPGTVDAAVLCAAVSSLKRCKEDPGGSRDINVLKTVRIAETLLAGGARVVFPSSSLVFDGLTPFEGESAPTCPRTEYGRQKVDAERRLLALDPARVAILRFTKIVGPGLPLFDGWLRSFRSGEVCCPFEDLRLAPVSLSLMAEAVGRVVDGGRAGVFHVSAAQDVSYADAALHLAARLSADGRLVQPVSSISAGADLEHIPRHAALGAKRLSEECGIAPPRATDALDELISP